MTECSTSIALESSFVQHLLLLILKGNSIDRTIELGLVVPFVLAIVLDVMIFLYHVGARLNITTSVISVLFTCYINTRK